MVERYRGCVLGLAVGDALGFPTEFMSVSEIREKYGPLGVTDFVAYHRFPLGSFTDDTQMSVALAEGLLERPEADLDALMVGVARRFVNWSTSPENTRAPGMSCLAGSRNLAQGVSWRESGVPDSKGCGAAMRAAPIGLLYASDRARLLTIAQASSLPTHGHPCARAGAVATALATALALEHRDPRSIFDTVLAETAPISREFAEHLARVPRALELPPAEAFALLGEGWVSEEAVAAALYCFLVSPDDYAATVLRGANTEGDSDSVACIAGAISGAWNGESAIPQHWRQDVEKADRLIELAERLYAAATDLGGPTPIGPI